MEKNCFCWYKNDLVPEDTQKLAGDDLLESAEIIKFPDDTDFAEGGIVSLTWR